MVIIDIMAIECNFKELSWIPNIGFNGYHGNDGY